MDNADLMVRGTAWLSTGFFATSAALELASCTAKLRRRVWTIGCLTLLVHEALAVGLLFDGSQALAWRHIAEQTRLATGLDWGGGLVVNYAAAVVWTVDAGWWWVAPVSRARRSGWWNAAVWGFLAAMFFFGAVVFATSWLRFVAAMVFVVLSATALRRWRKCFVVAP